MSSEFFPLEGGCRCGQVRFRMAAPPVITMACHCTGCQRMSASAFSLSAAIPSDAFLVIQGEPVIGGLHGPTRHFFCAYCMSWMFTRPDGFDAIVNVRVYNARRSKTVPAIHRNVHQRETTVGKHACSS